MFLQPANNSDVDDAANVLRDDAGMVASFCTIDIKDKFICIYL